MLYHIYYYSTAKLIQCILSLRCVKSNKLNKIKTRSNYTVITYNTLANDKRVIINITSYLRIL